MTFLSCFQTGSDRMKFQYCISEAEHWAITLQFLLWATTKWKCRLTSCKKEAATENEIQVLIVVT